MQMILKSSTLEEVMSEVTSFPMTISEMYTHILNRISEQSSTTKIRATKILSWIFRARRPLLVRELQQALTTSLDDTNEIIDEYSTDSAMVNLCLGLVTVDEERSIIRFVHFSVQEFLQERPFILEDESTVASTCLAFLNFDVFASGQCKNNRELEDRLLSYPFLSYAARYWAIHGKGCEELTFQQLAVKFLCSEHHLACATQMAGHANLTHDRYDRHFPRKISGLHVVASYGLVQLVDVLLQQLNIEVDIKDELGQTPTLYAAKQGHTTVLAQLARWGARIEIKDEKYCRSALSWATLNGHTSVVKWILSRKADIDINSFDYQHSTALHLAFERHHHSIVDLLIEQGASLNIVDQWQRTQAQLAFSDSSPVQLADYEKDKELSKPIAQGGQARVAVFRKRGATMASLVG